jgi:hypothetical protein
LGAVPGNVNLNGQYFVAASVTVTNIIRPPFYLYEIPWHDTTVFRKHQGKRNYYTNFAAFPDAFYWKRNNCRPSTYFPATFLETETFTFAKSKKSV